jgi:hypothetical protein
MFFLCFVAWFQCIQIFLEGEYDQSKDPTNRKVNKIAAFA